MTKVYKNTIGRESPVLSYQDDDGIVRGIKVDLDTEVLHVQSWIWNPDTLDWERMKQPTLELTGDLTVTMGDVEKLLANDYWKDQRLEYSGGDLVYKGFNTTHKAAVNATTWYIWKYTWVGNDCTRIEGPLVGAWSNNAGLAWG